MIMWRIATAIDLDRIAELGRQPATAPRWSDTQIKSILADSSRIVLVSKHADEVTGFAVFHVLTDQAELENVVIAEAARRKGEAGILLRAGCGLVAARGVRRVLLEVRASNEAALRLYKKVGFSECGRRKNYYSAPEEDAVLMKLRL